MNTSTDAAVHSWQEDSMTMMSNFERHRGIRTLYDSLDEASFRIESVFTDAQERAMSDLISLKSILDSFQWQPAPDTTLEKLLLENFQDFDFGRLFHVIEFADAHAKLSASENMHLIQPVAISVMNTMKLCKEIDSVKRVVERWRDWAYDELDGSEQS